MGPSIDAATDHTEMNAMPKIGRPSTGTVEWRKNTAGVVAAGETVARPWCWHARITRKKGIRPARPWVPLDPLILEEDRGAALACAVTTAAYFQDHDAGAPTSSPAVAAARPSAPPAKVETAADWFKRFHAAKEAKGLVTVRDIRGRANKWFLPALMHKPMTEISRADLEAIVVRLDAHVAAFQKQGPGKGRLSPSTAANVWGDLKHAFDEAVSAKDPALRVLEVSPARDVRGPETGAERESPILYSDELLALLTGKRVDPMKPDIPLRRRHLYAMAVYTKARSSELEALTPADVDLVHETITVSKQADANSEGRAGTKQTKTKHVRTVDIEPNLLPLLEQLVKHPEGKGRRLLHMPPPEDRAELLREDLGKVGITRAALFIQHDPLQRAIVFHDLRDTGLTHMAVRGDNALSIMWAAGHTDFDTTQGYISRGQVWARRIGAPLPPLPPEVLAKPSKRRARVSSPEGRLLSSPEVGATKEASKQADSLRPQRELKARNEGSSTLENLAAVPIERHDEKGEWERKSEPIPVSSRPFEVTEPTLPAPSARVEGGAEPTDTELERGILDAVRQGLGRVAETLSRQLDARLTARDRAARENVIELDARRAPKAPH